MISEESPNWFKNMLCLSIKIARLRALKKAEEQIFGKGEGSYE
jgi:hypothetical protein